MKAIRVVVRSGGPWAVEHDEALNHAHAYPVGDHIAHTLVGDCCPCGPTVTRVECEDCGEGAVIKHHSLDGREARDVELIVRLDHLAAGLAVVAWGLVAARKRHRKE